MSDLTITAAAALTGANLAADDYFPVVDTSASAGSKGSRMTAAEVFAGLLLRGNTSLGTNTASGAIALGTITDTTPRPLCLAQTWNNASFAGSMLEMKATVTMAAAGANFINFLGGAAASTQVAYVRKDGFGYFAGGFNTGGNATISGSTTFGNILSIPASAAGYITTTGGSPANLVFAGYLGTNYALGVLNSTNACIFQVYRTYTNSTNYERAALQSGSGYFELAAETAGTGTDNLQIRIKPAGNEVAVLCDSAGNHGVAVSYSGSVAQVGFFGASPAAKPTGVAVDAAGIHAALVTLGLIAA